MILRIVEEEKVVYYKNNEHYKTRKVTHKIYFCGILIFLWRGELDSEISDIDFNKSNKIGLK